MIANHSSQLTQVDSFEEIVEQNKLHPKKIKVFPTGIDGLDCYTGGGFHSKEISLLSAPTGCGKTAFVVHCICYLIQTKPNIKILYASFEMSPSIIIERIVRNLIRITNPIEVDIQTKYPEVYSLICGKLFFVRDETLSIEVFIEDENLKKNNYDIIFLDYAIFLESCAAQSEHFYDTSKYINIMKCLLKLAKEQNIAMVLVNQLKAEKHTYTTNDQALSSYLANFSSLVLQMYFDEPSKKKVKNKVDGFLSKRRFDITKNRNGVHASNLEIFFVGSIGIFFSNDTNDAFLREILKEKTK